MKYSKILYIVFIVLMSGISMASVLYARPYGRTGRSGKQGATCAACHFGQEIPELTLMGPSYIEPGETVDFMFTVDKNSDNVNTTTAGFNVAVSEGLISGKGEIPEMCTDLDEPDNDNRTCINGNEIAQARPTLLEDGKAVYEFSWTAPLTLTGEVIFYGAGVAARSGAGAFSFDIHAAAETFTVMVQPPTPPVALIAADPISGTIPLEVTLDGSDSSDVDGTVTAYSWQLDGAEIGNTSVITQLFESPGNYLVELEVTDDDNLTATDSITIEVEVGPQPPQASFAESFSSSDSQALTIEFDASSSVDLNNDIVRYVWAFGDGNFGEGIQVSHTYAAKGKYTVSLEVI
ncbi:MAG: PKD domain-containing protein, partial [Chloroflexota bacterium]